MPIGARLESPGTLHHVIVRGIEKKPIVDDDVDCNNFVERMGRLSQKLETPVYARVLMDKSRSCAPAKRTGESVDVYARPLDWLCRGIQSPAPRHEHLLQNRYKSIVLNEDSYFKEPVRWIHSGDSFAETARFLGLSTSVVVKSKMRRKGNKSH